MHIGLAVFGNLWFASDMHFQHYSTIGMRLRRTPLERQILVAYPSGTGVLKLFRERCPFEACDLLALGEVEWGR